MPTARKLPSGSWRCQVFSGYKITNGKKQRVYESFTAPTKRAAEAMAAKWNLERDERPTDITVLDAIKSYISDKENVLSPSTIRGYNACIRRFDGIADLKLADVKTSTIQPWISDLAAHYACKSVKNTYGLLTAALEYHCPGKVLKVTLPAKVKPVHHLPSDADLQKVLDAVWGTPLWICIMLARYYSLRRSEICALDDTDLDGNILTIRKAVVKDKDCNWVLKDMPKTYGSYRYLVIDEPLLSVLTGIKGRYFEGTPNAMSCAFDKIVKKVCDTPFTFHSLRHMFATKAAMSGVPDFFTAQMGGWKQNSTVLKEVYQNVRDDDLKAQMQKLNQIMQHEMLCGQSGENMHHEMQHENKKAP